MFYIMMDEDKNLIATAPEEIYRGEDLHDKISFLIPNTISGVSVANSTVYANWIIGDGLPELLVLVQNDTPYNANYLQYNFPVNFSVTRRSGEVMVWLNIYENDSAHVVKSGDYVLRVLQSNSLDSDETDDRLALIDDIDDRVNAIDDIVNTKVSDKSFVYTQSTPDSVWIISHNLNKFPSVSIVDSAGTVVCGDVKHIDANNMEIAFCAAFSGRAFLN